MQTHVQVPASTTTEQARQQHQPEYETDFAQLLRTPQFEDGRPEVTAQLHQQSLMANSPRTTQLRAMQSMMANSPRVSQLQATQSMMAASPKVQQLKTTQTVMATGSLAKENHQASVTPFTQRMEDEEPLQAKADEPVQREQAEAQSPPKPNNTGLPDNLKSGIENLSGMSMDHVKVHYNSDKPAQLQAHAYAQGSEIHVASGQEQHLPHEAWHVVQQVQGRVRPTVQMKGNVPVNDDVGLEDEADVMGARALRLQAATSAKLPEPAAGHLKTALTIAVPAKQHVNGMQPLQLFQAQIITADHESGQSVITDIKLTGRTPSPFGGTMGAHSTAWTVHVDAVRRQLQGRTLDGAVAKLREMLIEEMNSPQWTSKSISANHRSNNPFGQGPGFQKAKNHAVRMSKTGYGGKDETGKAVWLEDFIDAYLDFVNRLPLATVRSGDTSADNEGDARQVLVAVEGGAKYKATFIRQNLAQMFATDTPGAFVKDMGGTVDINEVWGVALHAFLRGIRMAYPQCFIQAGLKDAITLGDFLLSMHVDVPVNILKDLKPLGFKRTDKVRAPSIYLNGGAGDVVGGDLVVQIRLSDKGVIENINMEGRTPSPFVGSMGAHSTAWAAHLDGVRSILAGRTIGDAIQAILVLSNEAQRSPLLSLVPFILPDQARLLSRSQVQLQYFQHLVLQKGGSDMLKKSQLQQLIAAYLQFENALPLHTAEATDTGGNGEGTHRPNLLEYEAGTLREIKARPRNGTHRPINAVSLQQRVKRAFWGMYDPGSANAFAENLFPLPLPSTKRPKRIDGRPSRATGDNQYAIHQVEEDNRQKKSSRNKAFREKPLADDEDGVKEGLYKNSQRVNTDGASSLLPQAMALKSFLHTMAMAYPSAFAACWGKLDKAGRSSEIDLRLRVDGKEVLLLMSQLPDQALVKGSGPLPPLTLSGGSSSVTPLKSVRGVKFDDLVNYEQQSARRDGITAQYTVGHASGNWNACLIYSLLRHALGRDATGEEVKAVRQRLVKDHKDIDQMQQINIYSPTGHAVIETIEDMHHVSLNVAVVTTRDAPVIPVTQGRSPALLYLMPGHFAPCWRKN